MKMFKKITAATTALVMSVGMMSVGASAAKVSRWEDYDLYMYSGMPSGYENKPSVTIGENTNSFYLESSDYITVIDRKLSMSADRVGIIGYATVGGKWREATTFYHYSTEATEKSSGRQYCKDAEKDKPAKVKLTMYYTYVNKEAKGQIIAK